VHILAGALVDDHLLHDRAAVHRLVGDLLEVDGLAAQPGAVAGDHDFAARVGDAVGQRLLGEAAVDHAVDGADLGGGEHGNRQFRHAPHVDGDGVALLDAHRLEHIGKAVDRLPELEVAVGALLAVLAFPQQRQLVLAPALDVAVQCVVDDIGLAADEPLEEGRLAAVQYL
jgi:hypothetical protein